MSSTKDELRNMIIETRVVVKKLTKIWENFPVDFDDETADDQLLICDSCEEKEE